MLGDAVVGQPAQLHRHPVHIGRSEARFGQQRAQQFRRRREVADPRRGIGGGFAVGQRVGERARLPAVVGELDERFRALVTEQARRAAVQFLAVGPGDRAVHGLPRESVAEAVAAVLDFEQRVAVEGEHERLPCPLRGQPRDGAEEFRGRGHAEHGRGFGDPPRDHREPGEPFDRAVPEQGGHFDGVEQAARGHAVGVQRALRVQRAQRFLHHEGDSGGALVQQRGELRGHLAAEQCARQPSHAVGVERAELEHRAGGAGDGPVGAAERDPARHLFAPVGQQQAGVPRRFRQQEAQ